MRAENGLSLLASATECQYSLLYLKTLVSFRAQSYGVIPDSLDVDSSRYDLYLTYNKVYRHHDITLHGSCGVLLARCAATSLFALS